MVIAQLQSILKGLRRPSDETDLLLLNGLEHMSMRNPLAPMFWNKTENFRVWNSKGQKWIDFTSAVAVANSGHANASVMRAIKKAVDDRVISTFTFPHRYRLKLYQKIKNLFTETFHEEYKSHFLSGGSEAIECALDLALAYSNKKKSIIISFFNAFHGNTCRSNIMSGSTEFSSINHDGNETIFLKLPYVSRQQSEKAKFADLITRSLSQHKLDEKDVAAIVIEPYQGRGVFVLDEQYAQEIGQFCKENEVLLIVDEIQTGFFRTGKLLASQYFNFSPDIVCLGKGLASSLPISGIIAKSRIFDETKLVEVLTTQSSNPICCAAALANIDFLSKNSFQKRLQQACIIFSEKIQKLSSKNIDYIESFGLAGSIHITENGAPSSRLADLIVKKAFEHGLLLNLPNGPYKSYVRITPPLTISVNGLEDGFKILKKIIEGINTE